MQKSLQVSWQLSLQVEQNKNVFIGKRENVTVSQARKDGSH
jgi:hypothetical protein